MAPADFIAFLSKHTDSGRLSIYKTVKLITVTRQAYQYHSFANLGAFEYAKSRSDFLNPLYKPRCIYKYHLGLVCLGVWSTGLWSKLLLSQSFSPFKLKVRLICGSPGRIAPRPSRASDQGESNEQLQSSRQRQQTAPLPHRTTRGVGNAQMVCAGGGDYHRMLVRPTGSVSCTETFLEPTQSFKVSVYPVGEWVHTVFCCAIKKKQL